jgi:hypothetical protein
VTSRVLARLALATPDVAAGFASLQQAADRDGALTT